MPAMPIIVPAMPNNVNLPAMQNNVNDSAMLKFVNSNNNFFDDSTILSSLNVLHMERIQLN
jgi:hypothetical protein